MTQEDKQLLLIDLCTRVPHGVKCYVENHYNPLVLLGVEEIYQKMWAFKKGEYIATFWNDTKRISDIKPYLRPMSSMTEEEYENFIKVLKRSMVCRKCYDRHEQWIQTPSLEEWLNAHHFDYRELIEKDLALPAPEGMYNFKND